MHARRCCAVGTLLAPERLSAPFWPILYPDGKVSALFITDVVVLSKHEVLLHSGRSGACLFKGPPNTNMVAVQLDFRELTATVESCNK